MSPGRHVALLRGINVGGSNVISMAALRAAFEAEGFEEVRTFIASGNVLFESAKSGATLETIVEAMLARRVKLKTAVMVRSRAQLKGVVRDAPAGFGKQPARYHSDVIFLKRPLTAAAAMRVVELREGVDRAWPGRGVVYFARLSARRTQSRMGRVVGKPEYRLMTIRSWSTTKKLAALLD